MKSQFSILSPTEAGGLDSEAFQQLILQLGGLIDQVGQDQATAAQQAAQEQTRAQQEAQQANERIQREQEQATRAAAQALDDLRRAAEQQRADLLRTTQLRSRLAGADQGTAARFQREINVLAQSLPDVSDLLTGLNLDTPGDREALRKRLLTLFDQFNGADFNNLNVSRDDFLAFITNGADALDSFNRSVQDATKQMLNFPTGINLAALEFQAQAAGANRVARVIDPTDNGRLPMPQRFQPIPEFISRPGARGSDGSALPLSGDLWPWMDRALTAIADQRRGGGTIIQIDRVEVVVQGAGKNGRQIAQETLAELRRVSMSRHGTPDKWGAS